MQSGKQSGNVLVKSLKERSDNILARYVSDRNGQEVTSVLIHFSRDKEYHVNHC